LLKVNIHVLVYRVLWDEQFAPAAKPTESQVYSRKPPNISLWGPYQIVFSSGTDARQANTKPSSLENLETVLGRFSVIAVLFYARVHDFRKNASTMRQASGW